MIDKKSQRSLLSFLSLSLGIGLCFGLASFLELSANDIHQMFTHNGWPAVFLLPFSLTILLMFTGAYKWKILSQAFAKDGVHGQDNKFSFFMRHYLWQNWVGLFVPPSIAIIAGRGIAQRHDAGFKSGAFSGFLDQGLEFLFTLVLIPTGLMFLLKEIGGTELLSYSLVLHLLLAALLWFVALFWRPALKTYFLPVLFLSSLRVFLTLVRLAVGAMTLGLALSFWDIFSSGPVVALVSLIPMTPGNLGVAEWGWTGILVWAGGNPVDAGLLAIGFRLLIIAIQTMLLGFYEVYAHFFQK